MELDEVMDGYISVRSSWAISSRAKLFGHGVNDMGGDSSVNVG